VKNLALTLLAAAFLTACCTTRPGSVTAVRTETVTVEKEKVPAVDVTLCADSSDAVSLAEVLLSDPDTCSDKETLVLFDDSTGLTTVLTARPGGSLEARVRLPERQREVTTTKSSTDSTAVVPPRDRPPPANPRKRGWWGFLAGLVLGAVGYWGTRKLLVTYIL